MDQPEIVMYATDTCPYCQAARRLFNGKAVRWTEISVSAEPGRKSEMIERSGRRTVPQVFIGNQHIGGFDDLDTLDQEGALDRLLGLQ